MNVGGGFTSINAQWQIQRMTEQFGPVGKGWGYKVDHSIERIAEDYVLAVADVTIYWHDGQTNAEGYNLAHTYGPIRGMAPILDKSKNGYLMKDDDAGKKAATDALTKGLSHLGLSADVFLGLYDDNKYVREAGKHFAEHQHDNDGPGSSWGPGGKASAVEEAERDGLTKNAPKATAAVLARAKARVDKDIQAFRMVGQTRESLMEMWAANRDAYDKIYEMVPAEHERLVAAYDEALQAAPKAAA